MVVYIWCSYFENTSGLVSSVFPLSVWVVRLGLPSLETQYLTLIVPTTSAPPWKPKPPNNHVSSPCPGPHSVVTIWPTLLTTFLRSLLGFKRERTSRLLHHSAKSLTLYVTIIYGMSRRRCLKNPTILLNLPISDFNMLDWLELDLLRKPCKI